MDKVGGKSFYRRYKGSGLLKSQASTRKSSSVSDECPSPVSDGSVNTFLLRAVRKYGEEGLKRFASELVEDFDKVEEEARFGVLTKDEVVDFLRCLGITFNGSVDSATKIVRFILQNDYFALASFAPDYDSGAGNLSSTEEFKSGSNFSAFLRRRGFKPIAPVKSSPNLEPVIEDSGDSYGCPSLQIVIQIKNEINDLRNDFLLLSHRVEMLEKQYQKLNQKDQVVAQNLELEKQVVLLKDLCSSIICRNFEKYKKDSSWVDFNEWNKKSIGEKILFRFKFTDFHQCVRRRDFDSFSNEEKEKFWALKLKWRRDRELEILKLREGKDLTLKNFNFFKDKLRFKGRLVRNLDQGFDDYLKKVGYIQN